jgi:hypothetical protein
MAHAGSWTGHRFGIENLEFRWQANLGWNAVNELEREN